MNDDGCYNDGVCPTAHYPLWRMMGVTMMMFALTAHYPLWRMMGVTMMVFAPQLITPCEG